MSIKIKITAGDVNVEATLNDSSTALDIADALPIQALAQRWGEEIYFSIPVEADLEPGATAFVNIGDLAFWPSGNAFCMFFGPTPISSGNEIQAASGVNIIGTMQGDFSPLSTVLDGNVVRIEKC